MIPSSRIRLFFSTLFIWGILSTQVYAETIIRGPYLQMGTENSMVLRWRTDTAGPSTVEYGIAVNNLTGSITDATSTTEHEIQLTGLAADTRYYYAIIDDNENILAGNDSAHSFITSPEKGSTKATRVWVIGDSGTANADATNVYNAYLANTGSQYTNLWLMLGDNAYNDGTDGQYQNAVFNMYPELLRQTPVWPTLGNHDGHSADSASQTGPYYDIFTLPKNAEAGGVASGTEAYYSFDHANIHFICLESYETDRSVGGAMLTWLENDLQNTTQDWVIAFWHHPPYTKGSHNSDTESQLIQMRENALPILESYGVDLVLSGHSHSYERSFLLDGHYDVSSTFSPAMKLDGGSGQEDGDGAYHKPNTFDAGAVYIVAGSSGKISGGSLNHPAMYVSLNSLGSVILDIAGDRMDVSFINAANSVQDYFTLTKGSDITPPTVVLSEATSDTEVEITFSEALEATSAENAGNYSIDQGISLLNAVLSANGRIVTLTTSPVTPGIQHTITVSNVADLNGNVITANTETTFTYINLITLEFQNGSLPDAGYNGTDDTYLSQGLPDSVHGAETILLLDGDDGGGVDLASILLWDITDIPADATIESASITIEVFNPSNSSYSIFEMKQPWVENEATWNQYATGLSWQTAGAQGNLDRGASILANVNAGSTGLNTTPLNANGTALVQGWVDGTIANNGLIIADSSSADGIDFRSSEDVGSRPKFTVTYSIPISPGDTEAPTTPGNLQTTSITETTVSLAWDPSTDNVGVSGYQILRDNIMIDTTNTNSYSDSNLQPGALYSYDVIAYDAANNQSVPASLDITTDSSIASVHVSAIDMSTTARRKNINGNAHILLLDNNGLPVANATVSGTWSGLVNQTVSNLTVSDGSANFTSAKVSKNSNGQFIFTVSSIIANGYSYDAADNLVSSGCIDTDNVLCSTDPNAVPAPTGLTSSYDGTNVALSWNEVTQANLYRIYRSNSSGSGYTWIDESISNSYTDITVSPDNIYYYVITAVAGADESANSGETSADTSSPAVLHADSVTVSLKRKGNKWDATAIVKVVNANDNSPMANAVVSGNWSVNGSNVGTDTGTTNNSGQASIKLARQSASSGDPIRFTVTDISHSGGDYDGLPTSGEAIVP